MILECCGSNIRLQKVSTSLVPLAKSTTQGWLFVLFPGMFSCLMDHSRSGKWISYNFLCLMDINISQSWSVCCHTELKPSLTDRPLSLLWLKSFWKRLFLPGKLLWNCIVLEKPILLAKCSEKSVLFGQFYNTLPRLTTLNPSCLVKWTNGIIKTQLAKFAETLQIPWPKVLSLVLLRFRSTLLEHINSQPLRYSLDTQCTWLLLLLTYSW